MMRNLGQEIEVLIIVLAIDFCSVPIDFLDFFGFVIVPDFPKGVPIEVVLPRLCGIFSNGISNEPLKV